MIQQERLLFCVQKPRPQKYRTSRDRFIRPPLRIFVNIPLLISRLVRCPHFLWISLLIKPFRVSVNSRASASQRIAKTMGNNTAGGIVAMERYLIFVIFIADIASDGLLSEH
jgi:hypothetical protein